MKLWNYAGYTRSGDVHNLMLGVTHFTQDINTVINILSDRKHSKNFGHVLTQNTEDKYYIYIKENENMLYEMSRTFEKKNKARDT